MTESQPKPDDLSPEALRRQWQEEPLLADMEWGDIPDAASDPAPASCSAFVRGPYAARVLALRPPSDKLMNLSGAFANLYKRWYGTPDPFGALERLDAEFDKLGTGQPVDEAAVRQGYHVLAQARRGPQALYRTAQLPTDDIMTDVEESKALITFLEQDEEQLLPPSEFDRQQAARISQIDVERTRSLMRSVSDRQMPAVVATGIMMDLVRQLAALHAIDFGSARPLPGRSDRSN